MQFPNKGVRDSLNANGLEDKKTQENKSQKFNVKPKFNIEEIVNSSNLTPRHRPKKAGLCQQVHYCAKISLTTKDSSRCIDTNFIIVTDCTFPWISVVRWLSQVYQRIHVPYPFHSMFPWQQVCSATPMQRILLSGCYHPQVMFSQTSVCHSKFFFGGWGGR